MGAIAMGKPIESCSAVVSHTRLLPAQLLHYIPPLPPGKKKRSKKNLAKKGGKDFGPSADYTLHADCKDFAGGSLPAADRSVAIAALLCCCCCCCSALLCCCCCSAAALLLCCCSAAALLLLCCCSAAALCAALLCSALLCSALLCAPVDVAVCLVAAAVLPHVPADSRSVSALLYLTTPVTGGGETGALTYRLEERRAASHNYWPAVAMVAGPSLTIAALTLVTQWHCTMAHC